MASSNGDFDEFDQQFSELRDHFFEHTLKDHSGELRKQFFERVAKAKAVWDASPKHVAKNANEKDSDISSTGGTTGQSKSSTGHVTVTMTNGESHHQDGYTSSNTTTTTTTIHMATNGEGCHTEDAQVLLDFLSRRFADRGGFGGLLNDRLGHIFHDTLDDFFAIDKATGRPRNSIAGNEIFGFGGFSNDIGEFGKRYLEKIISGKYRRQVRPFRPSIPDIPISPDSPTPVEPVPIEPAPAEPVIPRPISPTTPSEPEKSHEEKKPKTPEEIQVGLHDGQDFYSIRTDLLRRKVLFEDPLFPASDKSLFYSRPPPFPVKWMRPAEICANPQFLVDGASRFDVVQGKLGDCWLLAATASLTLRKELFYRVVPPDQSFVDDYAGVFHFQFWQYGSWVDVVIDDRLPTHDGELVYMHSSTSNEFWPALLEKAYAKVSGGYECLKGGNTAEALVDFTGGLTESLDLKDNAPTNLEFCMFHAFRLGSLMGCSITSDVMEGKLSSGLITSHAYSITGVKSIEYGGCRKSLIRIRNPWGNEAEWKGPWSDGSKEWNNIPEEQRKEMGLVFDHDGEFWMGITDFSHNFTTLELCHLGPDVEEEIRNMIGANQEQNPHWEEAFFHGSWVIGQTAGGCANNRETFASNPQFCVNIRAYDPSDPDVICLVAVLQKHRRLLRNKGEELLPIGFSVYRVDDQEAETVARLDQTFLRANRPVAKTKVFSNLREVIDRSNLPPGTYVVVPSTFDRDQPGEFLLRVFSDGDISSRNLA